MRILMALGSGIPIPPPSWGGAENIVHQQRLYLESRGHSVSILNKSRKKTIAVLKARPWRYDIVHLHQDGMSRHFLRIMRLRRFRLAVTSHYGYAAFPEKWEEHGVGFGEKVFPFLLKTPHQITLSDEIAQTFRARGYRGTLSTLPNGIHTQDIRFDPSPASHAAILLGRIEPRKKQRWLTQALAGHPDASCDLIGPCDDPEFAGNGANVPYLGSWKRDQVKRDLTGYAAMALLSDGEAHAGVLLEALAAGLSLIVTRESAHNFDLNLPFVYVVDRDKDDIAAVFARAVAENPLYRAAARRYVEETFDWRVIGPRYESILEGIVREPH